MSPDPEYGSDLPPRFVLPPTLFLTALGVQWTLARWVPGPALPGWAAEVATAAGTASALVALIGVSGFALGGTSVQPFTRADALLTGGVYRFTRNPIYLGLVGITLAFGLKLGSVTPLLVPPLLGAALGRVFIRREEAYLARRFGEAYERYRARVRRWL